MKKLRWGIIGAADIARQNWRAIYDSGNSVVAGVAGRNVERTSQFITQCQADYAFEGMPRVFNNYHQLIDSPEIDAVYIPLPTGLRKEYVLRAAKAGKHILCEKPCGLCGDDVQEMIETCRDHNVQFMDGVMFMHNPRLRRIREVLNDSRNIGQIKRISSMFSFCASEEYMRTNIRLHSELEPAGCLGDLGWYNIRFSLWTMNWQLPHAVTGRIISQRANQSSPAPTPADFSGELLYNDVSAGFFCSFLTASQQWSIISGSDGSLSLTDFVHPANIHEPSFEVNQVQERVKCCDCTGAHTDSRTYGQDTLMIRNFVNQINSGRLNEEWPRIALLTQRVVDACYESAVQNNKLVLL
ncbi:MAG: gfo/Idh/MocA family oxidoreductase [Ignavibacteriae bacterium]|nr:MAG: gfo/Idh/MocA family oxidoreductase [Ignavibacteriota bacterium]